MLARKMIAVSALVVLFAMACFTTPGFAEKSSPENADYLIGKSDVLEINVWKEKDLTKTVRVRKDGKISLPLVDDVQAAGRTPMELKETLQQGLSEYIESPTVTVIVQSQASRRYYIIGEVAQTGEYELIKDLSVVQAITKAGGFTEWADRDDILLLRHGQGGADRINVDYNEIVSGEGKEQNIMLQADDTIIVR